MLKFKFDYLNNTLACQAKGAEESI